MAAAFFEERFYQPRADDALLFPEGRSRHLLGIGLFLILDQIVLKRTCH